MSQLRDIGNKIFKEEKQNEKKRSCKLCEE